MVRIISKEEEREDPRRDSSIYLRVQWCFHIPTRTTVILQELQDSFEYSVFLQELQCFYTQSSHPVLETNSSTRNTTTTRLILCHPVHTRHLPATVPRASKQFFTAESSYKAPYSIPGPHSASRLPVILPGRNSILHGSQHPCSPYSNSQASSTLQNSTRRNRILSKGLSIVYPIQY